MIRMQRSERADGFVLLGVFSVNLSLLVLELSLTRIFSVTLFYHFAFIAISLALLGIAAAGAVVYALAGFFPREAVRQRLALAAMLYAIATIVALVLYLAFPVAPNVTAHDLLRLVQACAVLTLPFLFGGLCIALALTHFTGDAGRVYCADLAGAGMGALLTVPALSLFGGPNTVFLTSALATLGALSFAISTFRQRGRWSLLMSAPAVLLLLLLGGMAFNLQTAAITIKHTKGRPVPHYLYERWNSFSRVTVVGDETATRGELGRATWGLSDRFSGDAPPVLEMAIDDLAGTPIVHWNGNPASVEFLRWDVTSLVYHIQPYGDALIIGPGGGRDVLAALIMGKERVTAVEINPAVVAAVRERFDAFAGGLYRDPRVRVEIDDARSYLERSRSRYDTIQASMIDTWAATMAGAYVMTEQHLYTREAFVAYYRRLTDNGIFTASRWYQPAYPAEALRLASLAVAGWKEAGVADPAGHIMLVGKEQRDGGSGIVTLLLKRSPFTPAEVEQARRVARDMGFQVLYDPLVPNGNDFERVIRGPDAEAFIATYPLDISPPGDDRPFFFNMLRPTDFLGAAGGQNDANLRAVSLLVGLLLTMSLLAAVFVFAPLVFVRARRALPEKISQDAAPVARLAYFLLYFSCLGLGFMLIEIPMMQRFILFLGAPVYALAVVLFSILIFSGLGSLLTHRVPDTLLPVGIVRAVAGISLLALAYVLGLPLLFTAFLGMPIGFRIGIAVLLLAPLGFLMGMPFPQGIRLAGLQAPGLVPWLWAVNGATSVLASILAIAVAMQAGYSRALLLGVTVYAIALLVTLLYQRWRAPVTSVSLEPVSAGRRESGSAMTGPD